MSHLVKDVSKVHNSKESNPVLTVADFCSDKVHFTFGVPLIVLDFIDTITGSNFIQQLHEHMNPPKDPERFNCNDFKYQNMKDEIHERFLPNVFILFNALGGCDLKKYGATLTQNERESR